MQIIFVSQNITNYVFKIFNLLTWYVSSLKTSHNQFLMFICSERQRIGHPPLAGDATVAYRGTNLIVFGTSLCLLLSPEKFDSIAKLAQICKKKQENCV